MHLYGACLEDFEREMELLVVKVDMALKNGGEYPRALFASSLFLAATGSSRELIASNIVATIIGFGAVIWDGFHTAAKEENVAGMVGKVAMFLGYVVLWKTTAAQYPTPSQRRRLAFGEE